MRSGGICAMVLLLAGCASVPPDYDNNPFQLRAAQLITKYNSTHGLNLPVPVVELGPTQELAYATTWCHGPRSCFTTIDPTRAKQQPDYIMVHVVPHELAHFVCVLTVPGCMPDDHGPAWRRIALELGLPLDDPFIVRPEVGTP